MKQFSYEIAHNRDNGCSCWQFFEWHDTNRNNVYNFQINLTFYAFLSNKTWTIFGISKLPKTYLQSESCLESTFLSQCCLHFLLKVLEGEIQVNTFAVSLWLRLYDDFIDYNVCQFPIDKLPYIILFSSSFSLLHLYSFLLSLSTSLFNYSSSLFLFFFLSFLVSAPISQRLTSLILIWMCT